MYHCLKYNNNKQKILECEIFIEDGHCFNCPCCQTFENIEFSEEQKERILNKIIETAQIALKHTHYGRH